MSTGLLGFESIQERQGGVREYVSPSRLNCWLACPLKWKFRYIDRIKTPTSPSLFLGTVSHSALEVYYRHRQLGVTLDPQEVTRRLLENWGPAIDVGGITLASAAEEEALRNQAVGLVTAYLSYAPKDERPLAVEAAV